MPRSEAGRQRTMTDGLLEETVSPKPIRILLSGLTRRETEVVGRVERGLTNTSIASQLQNQRAHGANACGVHAQKAWRPLGGRLGRGNISDSG